MFSEPKTCGLVITNDEFMDDPPDDREVKKATHVLAEGEWLVISDSNLARGTDFRTPSPDHKVILLINKSAKHRRDFTQYVGRAGRHGDKCEINKHKSLKELCPRIHPRYQT